LAVSGCKPAQVTLAVDSGFYPSAIAHDPVRDRFFVASYATGAIAVVRRDGSNVGAVRPPEASRPILQLAYDTASRRLWVLAPDVVELIDAAQLPVRRTIVAGRSPGGRFADIVAAAPGQAYVLDGATGAIVELDADRRVARVIARLPDVPGDGALMVLPDRSALVAARSDGVWRVDFASRAVEPVALGTPLADVSQLVLVASDAVAHHAVAFRGRANEVVTIRFTADARRAFVDLGTRMRFDTPLHGAHDGRQVMVLLGRIRHHPSFGGDGRPNLPPRLAAYPAGQPPRDVRVAETGAGDALVR
jgi:DNA-binding beta-propeller fold protein YncE